MAKHFLSASFDTAQEANSIPKLILIVLSAICVWGPYGVGKLPISLDRLEAKIYRQSHDYDSVNPS